ncbi:hypothetical protein HZC07_02140 [Candidatus Micrarchaeota archaeon]|nr:hypothetical protein [Candidatus Micrarchaeota archaeon]
MTIYKPRPIGFVKLIEGHGHSVPFKVKLYGVTARGGESPRSAIISLAEEILIEKLMEVSGGPSIPEVPLVVAVGCVHETAGPDSLLTGVWQQGNELHTRVSHLDELTRGVVPRHSPSIPLCTWDIVLLAHERAIWIEKVLKTPTPQGVQDYLRTVLKATL